MHSLKLCAVLMMESAPAPMAIGFETGVELHIVLQCLKELHQRIGRTITAHLGMRLLKASQRLLLHCQISLHISMCCCRAFVS